jgi:hypothetical protein
MAVTIIGPVGSIDADRNSAVVTALLATTGAMSSRLGYEASRPAG